MYADISLDTKLYSSSVCFDFALGLKEWEVENLCDFTSSVLGQRFFVALAKSRRDDSVLRLTDLYIDTQASAVGVRKRIAQYTDCGFLRIVPNPNDGRARIVQIEPKFDNLLGDYFSAANRIWCMAVAREWQR